MSGLSGGGLAPRIVLVSRATEYERLLEVHATRGQIEFFLRMRGETLERVDERHHAQLDAMAEVRQSIPGEWRLAEIRRSGIERFLFGPEDIVVAVGQDGLIANLAKYVDSQPVLGVNPEPDVNEGVLAPLAAAQAGEMLRDVAEGAATVEARTMVEARLDDGQSLTALNEIFVGHASHQSARYELQIGGVSEYQSSSGAIIATGTGSTGWARSIMLATGRGRPIEPTARSAMLFTREAWPSKATGADLVHAEIGETETIRFTSRMNGGGVVFADGIEADRLKFDWGRGLDVGLSRRVLNLVRD